MKKYQTPEMEIAIISAKDIMTESLVLAENSGEEINWADGVQ